MSEIETGRKKSYIVGVMERERDRQIEQTDRQTDRKYVEDCRKGQKYNCRERGREREREREEARGYEIL